MKGGKLEWRARKGGDGSKAQGPDDMKGGRTAESEKEGGREGGREEGVLGITFRSLGHNRFRQMLTSTRFLEEFNQHFLLKPSHSFLWQCS